MCDALDACQPEPTDVGACVESCEGLSDSFDAAGCGEERDAFVQCIAGEFERTCNGGCGELAFEANECRRLATARE